MHEALIWLNGVLAPAEETRIDPSDRGFLLGDGIFETIRVFAGMPRHVGRHLARLQSGAAVLRLNAPPASVLQQALVATAAANQLSDGVLRLTITRGPGLRGVLPGEKQQRTMMITAAPAPPAPAPGRVVIARGIMRDAASPLSPIKSLNYLPSILARIEAAERGADDAILLNPAGDVAEASAANVFLYRNGAWLTPKVSDGALPGIRRAVLLESGTIVEATIPPDCLFEADALCLGNALGLRTISHVDGQKLRQDKAALVAFFKANGGFATGSISKPEPRNQRS